MLIGSCHKDDDAIELCRDVAHELAIQKEESIRSVACSSSHEAVRMTLTGSPTGNDCIIGTWSELVRVIPYAEARNKSHPPESKASTDEAITHLKYTEETTDCLDPQGRKAKFKIQNRDRDRI